MVTFESAGLWSRTLAAKPSDQFNQEREKLRAAFFSFRERAALLAAEITRDLPDYTVHDVTHLDALWQMADLIAGPDYELTPTEAFVLGGAFLTHDLGNALAAYPDGVDAMYASATWRDALSLILRKELGRAPTAEETQAANSDVKKAATAQVLRALHAQQAERLALVSWKDPASGAKRFLIEDEFLRDNYGGLIGRIAHSHWWNVDRLKPEFEAAMGAPAGYPPTWTVDPLKLSCLLRVADAAHLDARRAPAFLRAIRPPHGESLAHWSFQEKLLQPMQNGDRLVYSSAQTFGHAEAGSWWLCFDALQALDRELTGTDAILTDCYRPKFRVRGVQGAEDAPRLSKWVKTDGWVPVDTRIRVSDVAELASRLGGAQLYGEDNLVPLRELIQNASDAISARRCLEHRPADYGDITVRLGSDTEGHWIEVADNGIGMSEGVMTGALLDFGSPFWNSERMLEELPGLASSGFQSTGKYGIGFFSLFMWGTHVRVTSRRYRDAARDTRILEFAKGLRTRPTLRKAGEDECLADGGTAVRIWVGTEPESEEGILSRPGHNRKRIEDICEWLCPSLDTNVHVCRGASTPKLVVGASDWKTMNGEKLLRRLADDTEQSSWMRSEMERLIPLTAANLVCLTDRSGTVVGRAAIVPTDLYTELGAVTDGGLRAGGLRRIAGILKGYATTASRDVAIPTVEASTLADWASGQQPLIIEATADEDALASAADTISHCGGLIGSLPVAESSRGWLSLSEVREWGPLYDEIVIVEADDIDTVAADLGPVELYLNVLATGPPNAFFIEDSNINSWPYPNSVDDVPFRNRSTQSVVARLLAGRWSATIEEVRAASAISGAPNFESVEIGTIDGKPIERYAHRLRNPHASRPPNPGTTPKS
jgi:hypothetical protein